VPLLAQQVEHDVVEDDLLTDLGVPQEPAESEQGGLRPGGGSRVKHDDGVLLGGRLGEGGLKRGLYGGLSGLARAECRRGGGKTRASARPGTRACDVGGARAVGVDPEEPRGVAAGLGAIWAGIRWRRRVLRLGRRVLDGDVSSDRGGGILRVEGGGDWPVRP